MERIQREKWMGFNLGNEDISGAQTLVRGKRWIWGSRAKLEEGGEGEKSHKKKLIRLLIFQINKNVSQLVGLWVWYLPLSQATPNPVLGHFQGWEIHNNSGQVTVLETLREYVMEKVGKEAWRGIQGAWSGFRACCGCGRRQLKAPRETEERFPSWSYFRLRCFPRGIPIQQRTVPFLWSNSLKLCDRILY